LPDVRVNCVRGRQGCSQINQITDRVQQSNVAASTAILAGLVLDQQLINRVLRSDIMRESVIYQEIEAQGRQQEAQKIALNLLNEGASLDLIVRVTGLAVEQVQQLQRSQQSNP
jgi:predicted transposase YdaD